MLTGLQAKPELNGSAGVVVAAGEGGIGPDKGSGRYGVRLEYPKERRGELVRVSAGNVRLMTP